MNEWILVAAVIGVTIVLLGGLGWAKAILGGRKRHDD